MGKHLLAFCDIHTSVLIYPNRPPSRDGRLDEVLAGFLWGLSGIRQIPCAITTRYIARAMLADIVLY